MKNQMREPAGPVSYQSNINNRFKSIQGMNHRPELTVSPKEVPRNATITVRAEAQHFPQPYYTITDENGRVIRKGSVSDRISEFKLSMVGLATGAYHFTMGHVRQRFTIML